MRKEERWSCRRVKDGNRRLAQGEDEARKIRKEYFEDLYMSPLRWCWGEGTEAGTLLSLNSMSPSQNKY